MVVRKDVRDYVKIEPIPKKLCFSDTEQEDSSVGEALCDSNRQAVQYIYIYIYIYIYAYVHCA